MKTLRIAIFISGRGSNMEEIMKAIKDKRLKKVTVALVVSDHERAEGLRIARAYGVKTLYLDCAPYTTKLEGPAEARIIAILKKARVDLICLAGFMRLVKKQFVREFHRRIINIHPSLLPNFPGLHAQRQAIIARAKESGCTVHFVDTGMDTGEIIRQTRVPVYPDDTEITLSKRILEKEHDTYWRVIKDAQEGALILG